MGKHRTSKKYTGATKIEKNSHLGREVLNVHEYAKRELFDGKARVQSSILTSQIDDSDFATALQQADALAREFEANTRIVSMEAVDEVAQRKTQDKFMAQQQRLLRIPRRPLWTEKTSAQELHEMEEQSFEQWRARIATIEYTRLVAIAPYEKNLDFWRQLWRVVEFSDVVLQLVDARNPLLFYSKDLTKYVTEMGILQKREKRSILLLNKADLVPLKARQAWSEYFAQHGIDFVYFSALREEAYIKFLKNLERDEEKQLYEREMQIRIGAEKVDFDELDRQMLAKLNEEAEAQSECTNQAISQRYRGTGVLEQQHLRKTEKLQSKREQREAQRTTKKEKLIPVPRVEMQTDDADIADAFDVEAVLRGEAELPEHIQSPKIYTRQQLTALLKVLGRQYRKKQQHPKEKSTIGVIGYPNIGKSSTVNVLALHTGQRTSVGETPGKTKHFYTIELDAEMNLCDCPGLVFPYFSHSRADFVLNGILSIDYERDYVGAISLLCYRIPTAVFEKTYYLTLARPDKFYTGIGMQHGEEVNQKYCCDGEQLLSYMAEQKGIERGKCARRLVKDLFVGKIRWIYLPPVGIRAVGKREYRVMRKDNSKEVAAELGREMARYERLQRLRNEYQAGTVGAEPCEEDFGGEEEEAFD